MVRAAPLVSTPVPVRVAAFWLRSVAALIDALPVLTLWALIGFASGIIDVEAIPQSRWNPIDAAVDLLNNRPIFFVGPILLGVGLFFASNLLQEALFGVTLGKRVLNLTLVDRHGHRPETIAILIRSLLRLVSLLLFGWGYWWAAFDTERRALHDWVAGTWVVHRDDRLPTPRS
jgi:uncharacterized RDD family membrane protein YckC